MTSGAVWAALALTALACGGGAETEPDAEEHSGTEPDGDAGSAPASGGANEEGAEASPGGPGEPDADPLDGVHVALDPGHAGGIGADPARAAEQVEDGRGGWKDCQAVGASTVSGYAEHEFTWDVSLRLQELLEDSGAEVSLTREDDDAFGPCVDERGRFPQEVGADVSLSLHANGTEDSGYRGYFMIVSDPPLNDAQGEPSLELAEVLAGALEGDGVEESNLVDEGPQQRADIAGLNWSEVPSVMIELAEMRSPEDAALIESEEGRQAYAAALHTGLSEWAEQAGDLSS